MSEEKSIKEYKEPNVILKWLKSKFEKLKEIFSKTKKEQDFKDVSQELSEEELDKVKGGIPLKAVGQDELMADLGKTEPKSWQLNEEQLEEARKQPSGDELTEEELEDVKGGQPIIDDER